MSKYLPWGLGLVALILLAVTYRHAGVESQRANDSAVLLAASRDTLGALHARLAADTLPLAHIVDTVPKIITKIRTLILPPVDSAWHHADAAIALVPASDSACHTAYNGLRQGCEALRTQVVADTVLLTSIRDTLGRTRLLLAQATTTTADLSHQLGLVTKPYVCHLLVFIPCPSRTVTFFVGAGLGTAATLLIRR